MDDELSFEEREMLENNETLIVFEKLHKKIARSGNDSPEPSTYRYHYIIDFGIAEPDIEISKN